MSTINIITLQSTIVLSHPVFIGTHRTLNVYLFIIFLHKAGIYRETIDDIPFPKIPAQPIHQREAEILLR